MSAGNDVRSEKRDIAPRSVGRAGLLLAAITVGAMIVLLPFLSVLQDLSADREPARRPLAFEGERQPPAPRLQRYPTRDVQELRAEEEEVLGSYAWVDQEHGVVRIPIERAMALVAARGLPALGPSPAPAGGGR